MANMELITSVTVGSGGASSVTLPATGTIPQTYTDLLLKCSVRGAYSGLNQSYNITFNGSSTTGITFKRIYGNGSTAASDSNISIEGVGNTATASTFSNDEIYIPNYTSSNYKSFSIDNVTENNATTAYPILSAGLWSNTAAITSIVLTAIGTGGSFLQYCTFYLYGISNVTSSTKATGGIVSSDGTYNYHMFPYSGTFTPTTTLTCDYLVIAGGGGGGGAGTPGGGGGGAGGLIYQTNQSLSATGYSIVIGAGGTGGSYNSVIATNGGNSTFNSLTATGGGYGGTYPLSSYGGGSGGSGGGGTIGANGGASTQTSYTGTGFGNAGGNANGSEQTGAGGGGAGGAATNTGSNSNNATNGGIGRQYLEFANATQTGVNGYYAGGGGGGGGYYLKPTAGLGGAGGGGDGGTGKTSSPYNPGVSGIANTGGGGGGTGGDTDAGGYPTGIPGGNGGSGLVIIRYAI